MHDINDTILLLFVAYVDGSINEKQHEELDRWLKESPENKKQLSAFILQYRRSRRITLTQKINKEKAWEQIQKNINTPISIHNRPSIKIHRLRQRLSYLKYAAVFILLVGMAYFLKTNILVENKNKTNIVLLTDEDVVLRLGNGDLKSISGQGVEKIVNEAGEVIGIQEGDLLNYEGLSEHVKSLIYNELMVPYGKVFDIILSDGTKIKLNAGSSLKYPVKFVAGKQRKVYLSGEAYFDVTKDEDHPFIVATDQIAVRVLGTQFNVSSYPEDSEINTVLVEGAVRVYNNKEKSTDKFIDIKPGYKANWDKTSKTISSEKTDISLYTSWTTGKLIFRDMSFKTIRKKLERKYNVSIVNKNKLLDDNTFNATFDIETIDEVLKTLQRNFGIKYKTQQDTIIIN